MRNSLILSVLFVALLSSCSSSNDSTDPGTNPNGVDLNRPYGIGGLVQQVNVGGSTFDTVNFIESSAAVMHLTGAKDTGTNTFAGSYAFNQLPKGDYTLHLSLAGYAPSLFYFTLPRDTTTAKYILTRLYPDSWLKATIDLIQPDADTTNGLNIMTHMQTMDPTHIAVGSVYLFLSKTDAIDPRKPDTYDWICNYAVGYGKDSIQKLRIIPRDGRAHFASGTKIFCKAYASPYNQQYTYPSHDANGKEFYPLFGKYPTNTVSFQIP